MSLLLPSCNGTTKACAVAGQISASEYSNAGITQASPFTWVIVAERLAVTGTTQTLYLANASNAQVDYTTSANSMFVFQGAGLTVPSVTDGASHVLQFIMNGATSHANVDGVANSNSNSGTAGLSGIYEMFNAGTSQSFIGYYMEGGIVNGTSSSPNEASTCSNAFAYWGTSVSC